MKKFMIVSIFMAMGNLLPASNPLKKDLTVTDKRYSATVDAYNKTNDINDKAMIAIRGMQYAMNEKDFTNTLGFLDLTIKNIQNILKEHENVLKNRNFFEIIIDFFRGKRPIEKNIKKLQAQLEEVRTLLQQNAKTEQAKATMLNKIGTQLENTSGLIIENPAVSLMLESMGHTMTNIAPIKLGLVEWGLPLAKDNVIEFIAKNDLSILEKYKDLINTIYKEIKEQPERLDILLTVQQAQLEGFKNEIVHNMERELTVLPKDLAQTILDTNKDLLSQEQYRKLSDVIAQQPSLDPFPKDTKQWLQDNVGTLVENRLNDFKSFKEYTDKLNTELKNFTNKAKTSKDLATFIEGKETTEIRDVIDHFNDRIIKRLQQDLNRVVKSDALSAMLQAIQQEKKEIAPNETPTTIDTKAIESVEEKESMQRLAEETTPIEAPKKSAEIKAEKRGDEFFHDEPVHAEKGVEARYP